MYLERRENALIDPADRRFALHLYLSIFCADHVPSLDIFTPADEEDTAYFSEIKEPGVDLSTFTFTPQELLPTCKPFSVEHFSLLIDAMIDSQNSVQSILHTTAILLRDRHPYNIQVLLTQPPNQPPQLKTKQLDFCQFSQFDTLSSCDVPGLKLNSIQWQLGLERRIKLAQQKKYHSRKDVNRAIKVNLAGALGDFAANLRQVRRSLLPEAEQKRVKLVIELAKHASKVINRTKLKEPDAIFALSVMELEKIRKAVTLEKV